MTTPTLTWTTTTRLTTITWSSFPPKGRKVKVKRTEGPPARNGGLEGVLYYASVREAPKIHKRRNCWRDSELETGISINIAWLDRPNSAVTQRHTVSFSKLNFNIPFFLMQHFIHIWKLQKRSNCWRHSKLETWISINIAWLDLGRSDSTSTNANSLLSFLGPRGPLGLPS